MEKLKLEMVSLDLISLAETVIKKKEKVIKKKEMVLIKKDKMMMSMVMEMKFLIKITRLPKTKETN